MAASPRREFGAAPRLRAFRLWSLIHTWTSLVSMAFLLLLCLTGLPLIFHHELNHALGYEAAVPVPRWC